MVVVGTDLCSLRASVVHVESVVVYGLGPLPPVVQDRSADLSSDTRLVRASGGADIAALVNVLRGMELPPGQLDVILVVSLGNDLVKGATWVVISDADWNVLRGAVEKSLADLCDIMKVVARRQCLVLCGRSPMYNPRKWDAESRTRYDAMSETLTQMALSQGIVVRTGMEKLNNMPLCKDGMHFAPVGFPQLADAINHYIAVAEARVVVA